MKAGGVTSKYWILVQRAWGWESADAYATRIALQGRAPRRRGGEPHRAMFGRETFIVRVAEDAIAPRVRVGDYVWVDP